MQQIEVDLQLKISINHVDNRKLRSHYTAETHHFHSEEENNSPYKNSTGLPGPICHQPSPLQLYIYYKHRISAHEILIEIRLLDNQLGCARPLDELISCLL
jgi:hypothetical protein